MAGPGTLGFGYGGYGGHGYGLAYGGSADGEPTAPRSLNLPPLPAKPPPTPEEIAAQSHGAPAAPTPAELFRGAGASTGPGTSPAARELATVPLPPPDAPAPAEAPAAPNPLAMPGPALGADTVGKDQKRVSTTVASGQLAPEQKAALVDADKASQALVDAERKASGVRKEIADIHQMETSEAGALAAARAQRVSQIQEQGNARIEAARARAAQVEERFQKAEVRDFFADKGTGSKVLAAIAVGLGAIGSALAKGPNHALQIVQHTIDADLARQRANIDKMKDNVLFARTGIRDAEEAKEQLLADATARSAAELDVSAKKWAEMKARLGAPMEEVLADKNIATLRAAAAERRIQALEPLTKRVSTTTERTIAQMDAGAVPFGKFTADQAKSALLAGQMLGELETLKKSPQLSPKALESLQANALRAESADTTAAKGIGGSLAVSGARALGLVPKSKYEGLNAGEQRTANAWDNLTEKYARLLTGAGMSEGEARRMALQNAPHAGDTPAVIQQKLDRLATAAQQMLSTSGGAGALVTRAGGQHAPQGPVAAPAAPGKPSAADMEAIRWARDNISNPKMAEKARAILRANGM